MHRLRRTLQGLARDVRYGARMLARNRRFTLAAVVTIALGLGVNTAVFSIANAILLRTLPVRDGDRIVVIATEERADRSLHGVSYPALQDYREASREVFEDIAGYSAGFVGLAADGIAPARVLVTWVTGNYFAMLDLAPAAGRLLHAGEGLPGRVDPVVVLGHSAWVRRFGASADIVGRRLTINGISCTVVGVAPERFNGTFAFSDSELYLPLNWRDGDGFDDRGARSLHAIARLRPSATVARARIMMNVVSERLARQHPSTDADLRLEVVPERLARPEEAQYRTNAVAASAIVGMAGLVLVVAGVNLATLLLARAAARERELAIRAALGAGRARLVAQLTTESLLLAALGGGAGILAGSWLASTLARVRLPGDLPVRFDFSMDIRVLAYAVGLTTIVGAGAGLAAALRVVHRGAGVSLAGWVRAGGSSRGSRASTLLVGAQLACCFLLLAIAGVFARSLLAAQRADLGFTADRVLNVHMDVEQIGLSESRGRAFFDDVERQVERLPGVERAAYAFTVPMGYVRIGATVEAEHADMANRPDAGANVVSPEYFETMGIRLRRGRPFRAQDDEGSTRVSVVNERLAEMLWPRRDPIGQRFRTSPEDPWMEVIGVAATGKYQFLFEDPRPYFYVPAAQAYTAMRVLHVRTALEPELVAADVQRVIRELEPQLPLHDVQSMRAALGSGLGLFPARVAAFAVGAFGLLALILAAAGLYGVTSYLAGLRTHEIGVRVALGASGMQIVRLLLHDGFVVIALGIGAGTLGILLAAPIVGRFLFHVSPRDPLTLAAIAPMLASIAILACVLPARRAARSDPAAALRD